jgi:cell pole-organizing protein PopZ
MASAPGQNATVEEILASIRQAISEDDARRVVERGRESAPGPAARVSDVFDAMPEAEAGDIAEPARREAEPGEANSAIEEPAVAGPEQEMIESAIEQAIDGVRAELEGMRAQVPPRVEAAAARTAPRTNISRFALRRRESAPDRPALVSNRTNSEISASFERLTKKMVKGDGSIDGALEAMLRPMLTVWLDSNLPQMVERLVREEIERVTRGRR